MSGRRIGIDDPYAGRRVPALRGGRRQPLPGGVVAGPGASPRCSATRATSTPSRSCTRPCSCRRRGRWWSRASGPRRRPAAPSGAATRSFRQSFLVAFAHRIGDRLRQVAEATAAEAAAGPGGGGLLPVLARRADAAEAAAAAAFPDLTTSRPRAATPRAGWRAGRPPTAPTSGPTAQLGAGEGRRRGHWGRRDRRLATGGQEAMGSGAWPMASGRADRGGHAGVPAVSPRRPPPSEPRGSRPCRWVSAAPLGTTCSSRGTL